MKVIETPLPQSQLTWPSKKTAASTKRLFLDERVRFVPLPTHRSLFQSKAII